MFESGALIRGWTRCGRKSRGQTALKKGGAGQDFSCRLYYEKSLISNINLQDIVYGLNMSIL